MKKIDGRTKAGRARKLKLAQGEMFKGNANPEPAKQEDPEIMTGLTGNKYKLLETESQKTILQEAQELIYGDREAQYGNPKENLGNIALLWDAYLHVRYGRAEEEYSITPEDVCQMMALLKMARMAHSSKRDSIVDAAGYIGLIERIRA